jgi:hypothetical protein
MLLDHTTVSTKTSVFEYHLLWHLNIMEEANEPPIELANKYI